VTDRDLLRRFTQKRSEEAFRAIVDRYTGLVYSSCLRRLGERHDAEDATQAVFIALARKAGSIRRGGALAAWLYSAAEKSALQLRRERSARSKREREAVRMRVEEDRARADGQWDEVRPLLDEAVDSLPARYREALVLRYLADRPRKEVARELGLTEETAKTRIARGLERLRRRLAARGVAVAGGTVLAAMLTGSAEAAPAGLPGTVAAVCAGKAAASAAAVSIAEGAIKMMMWAKVKLVAACVAAAAIVGGVGAPVAMRALAQDAPIERPPEARSVYGKFNRFCIKHFSAKDEPLVHETFGKDLKVEADGSWQHFSETSAVIGWKTNLPAKTYVEYGPSTRYGMKTPVPERFFSVHVHYLHGLAAGRTYHCRAVSTDERGKKVVSRDVTFQTKRTPGTIRVPGDLGRPPYTLDKAGATYVVTADISSDGTAFFLAASNVKLDLNGHTVTYDCKKDTSRSGACGVRGAKRGGGNLRGLKILNGVIRRGKGGSTTGRMYDDLYGPVFFYRPSGMEMAGITFDYEGEQVLALVWINGGAGNDLHHNVFLDRSTKLINRHVGVDMTMLQFADSKVHHNLVKRTRHRGLKCGGKGTELYANEVYIDSWATNSYGLWVNDDAVGHHNRVYGSGFHPIGLMLGYVKARNRRYHSNYIQMQAVPRADIVDRWTGGQGGGTGGSTGMDGITPAVGLRLQKGPQDGIEFSSNVLVCKAYGEKALTRGMFLVPMSGVKNVVIKDNVIKVLVQDDKADGWAIAGLGSRGENITLEGNRIISNICNVRFGDPYGIGGTYRFLSNTFVKVGRHPRYKTVRIGYWNKPTSGHEFIDSRFEGGAGMDSVSFEGTGERDLSVGWSLDVKTRPGAKVTITDAAGKEAFSGAADGKGAVRAALLEYVHSPRGKKALTPHTVRAEAGGRIATKRVTMNRTQEMQIRP